VRSHTLWRCWAIAILLMVATPPAVGEHQDKVSDAPDRKGEIRILKTGGGVRFGLWNHRPGPPAPTLFIFASTIDETLGDPYYRQCGDVLAKRGYLCVSMDLPCHGQEKRADEPEGLAGWRDRIARGQHVIGEFLPKIGQVLDYLIAEKYTDAKRVAACGTSRGGFVALHFAAADPRVRCVAAFAPVTDLAVLREFRGLEDCTAVRSLALVNSAERLAGRAIWLVIGDRDRRVGTDHVIGFARSVSAASERINVPGGVELHVLPEPRGHTTPTGASDQAAAWIAARLR
jgi:dienelactone hydrolase